MCMSGKKREDRQAWDILFVDLVVLFVVFIGPNVVRQIFISEEQLAVSQYDVVI